MNILKRYIQFRFLSINLKSFKSHRRKTMSLRPYRGQKGYLQYSLSDFDVLSTQNVRQKNLRWVSYINIFDQRSTEKNSLKKGIFLIECLQEYHTG